MVKKKAKRKPKSVDERFELLWRILIGFVSGLVLGLWRWIIIVIAIYHAILILFIGKRDKQLAGFCGSWNSEAYRYIRYMTFESNDRPFPFTNLKQMGTFE